MKILVAATFAATLLAAFAAGAQERAPLHACDTLAGNPIDPEHVGTGVRTEDIRVEQAVAACLDAVARYPKEPRFMFQLGRAYRLGRRIADALQWYQAAADLNYPGAWNSLGVMYSQGDGVTADCVKAATYFQLAAAKGYPAADVNMRTLGCVRQV